MSFRRYAVERTAASAATFVLALIVIGFIYRVVPKQPPRADLPIAYGRYAEGGVLDLVRSVIVEQDLGVAFGGWSAGERAVDAASVTLGVVLGGLVVALALGGLAALLPVAGVRGVGYLLYGVGIIWAGLMLAYYVGFKLGLTPIVGYCWPLDAPAYLRENGSRVGCENDIVQWAYHLSLPWFTLALPFAAVYARVLRVVRVRGRADAELAEDERKRRRRLRRLKVVKLVGRDFGLAIGVAAIVEVLFGIPGLGDRLYEGIIAFDLPAGEAVLVVATALALGVQLAVDLVCGAIEPELRHA